MENYYAIIEKYYDDIDIIFICEEKDTEAAIEVAKNLRKEKNGLKNCSNLQFETYIVPFKKNIENKIPFQPF